MSTASAMTQTIKRPLPTVVHQLGIWVRQQVKAALGEPLTLKLRYQRPEGHRGVSTILHLPVAEQEDVNDIASELHQCAVEDADRMGRGGDVERRYCVQSYVPSSAEAMTNFGFSICTADFVDDDQPARPKAPGADGLLEAAFERMCTLHEAMSVNQVRSIKPITDAYRDMMTLQQTRVIHLEDRENEFVDLRRKLVMANEAALSQQAERERVAERDRVSARRFDDAYKKVSALLPTIVNRLTGTNLLPEKTTPAMEMLRAIVQSLRPEQLQQLQTILTPDQLMPLLELMRHFIEEEEKAQAPQEGRAA